MSNSVRLSGSKPRLANICVYCGSAAGIDPAYDQAARALGQALAANDVGLVYGGGGNGLMGVIARAVLERGGRVTGIIPEFLKRRDAFFHEAQEQIVVPDMHTRKRLMFERADAFVALPGGIGTLEELVEQLTWVQLERHAKPVLIADIGGFWRPLLALFEHMREHRFLSPATEISYLVAERIEDVLPMLNTALANVPGLPAQKLDTRL